MLVGCHFDWFSSKRWTEIAHFFGERANPFPEMRPDDSHQKD